MNLTKNKIFTYADDTALIFYGDTWTEVHKNAETGLQKVAQWLKDNLLTLNISKTSFLQFQTVNSHVEDINIKIHTCIEKSINCTCTNITKSETVKYLGVQLDCKLSWLPHIEMTTSRTRKLIWTFKTLRYAADFETLRTIYFALAQSVISYCVCVWGGACKSYLIQLERAQRSLLKVMTFRPYRYPTILLYKKCELLTIRQLFVYNIIIKQHADTPFDPKICRNKRRIPNVLPTVNFRTTLARRQRSYLSTFLYNKINKKLNFYPLSLRECKSITKTWLMTLNYCETEDLFN